MSITNKCIQFPVLMWQIKESLMEDMIDDLAISTIVPSCVLRSLDPTEVRDICSLCCSQEEICKG